MFCRQCGQSVESQPFCSKCGTPTGVAPAATAGGPGAPTQPPAPPVLVSRVASHLRTMGILWVVYAIYLVLHWMLVLPVLHAVIGGGQWWMAGSDTWVYAPFHPGGWLLHLIAVIVFVRAGLSLATGYVLLTRQPWGRTFAIVIAILTLLKPLLGTLLAIYTLWVLLGRNSGPEYDRIALAGETPL